MFVDAPMAFDTPDEPNPPSRSSSINGLTPRQLRFVDEYLVDLDPRAAAQRCGLPAGSGIAMLADRRISTELDRRQSHHRAVADVQFGRIVQELSRLAFSDIRQAISWQTRQTLSGVDPVSGAAIYTSRDEVVIRNSADLPDEIAAAIISVRNTKYGVAVQLADKAAALERLTRILGLDKGGSLNQDGNNLTAIQITFASDKADDGGAIPLPSFITIDDKDT